MNNYKIEVTDLFNGEFNYSWVRRYKIKAKSIRGAIQKLSRLTGGNHKFVGGDENHAIYHSVTGCIGVVVNRIGD